MPVTLTSTGIQFSDGTVSTYDTSLKPVATASGVSGTNTYTFSGINANAKRIQLQIYNQAVTGGPNYATVTAVAAAGASSSTLSHNITQIYSAGSTYQHSSWSNSDLFFRTGNYRGIPRTIITWEWIGNNPVSYPVYSVEWQAMNTSYYAYGYGNSSTSLANSRLSSITLYSGSYNFADLTATLYVEI